jgi:hypothetical protein
MSLRGTVSLFRLGSHRDGSVIRQKGSGAEILARTSAAIVSPVPERPVKRTPACSCGHDRYANIEINYLLQRIES